MLYQKGIKNMFFKKKKKIIHIDVLNSEIYPKKIEDVLSPLAEIIKVKVDINKKQIIITYENTLDEFLLQKKIEELGYNVTGIKDES